jgi:hypothetical protein
MSKPKVAAKKMAVTWDLVAMDEVPEPPTGARGTESRYAPLYIALRKMPSGHSLRVPFADKKEMSYAKTQLGGFAKKDGLRLLSSRNEENTLAWFWLGPKFEPLLKK